MRIAVDAMGGDFAPREIVAGAVLAARELKDLTSLVLVGQEEVICQELKAYGPIPPKLVIRHASEIIGMEETPALAIRKKKDNSISRMMDMINAGEVDAAVSAGNTGAMVVAATLKLRTLAGIQRPAIATVMPTMGRPIVLIDAGANTDCSPELLAEFGIMGSVYAREILGQPNPVVGLMSIGGEDSKGNETTKEAFRLLSAAPVNFRGNVEGHDLFLGETDVVVCDGFVGNVVLKTSESVAHTIGAWLKKEFKANPIRILGALLLRGALKSIKKKMDPEMFGGAPLLGVNGVCIITHGSSSRTAIYHAVRVACESVGHHVNDRIIEEARKLHNKS
ncbi:MAG: phosphate acyltransferase PlsX [bacterium]|jgi:glycerol-3-phosphate acyltransferase PlsX